jgi:4-hydroxy-tetrahydrodipicolinate reductase
MGAAVCAAVEADPELELVAAVDPAFAAPGAASPGGGWRSGVGGVAMGHGPQVLAEAAAEVAVDFTVASAVVANAAWCAANGVHAVVGTTGLSAGALSALRQGFEAGPANCVYAPNFAIGAVLLMRFAELAAPWFESVEVVELHHDAKLDSPSGTALLTAERISAARQGRGPSASPSAADIGPARGSEAAPGVRVHSVRLRGLVAHEEVLFGTTGQVLTLRHDSLDRSSFMPGVVLAIKAVPGRRGFTVGLDALLGL